MMAVTGRQGHLQGVEKLKGPEAAGRRDDYGGPPGLPAHSPKEKDAEGQNDQSIPQGFHQEDNGNQRCADEEETPQARTIRDESFGEWLPGPPGGPNKVNSAQAGTIPGSMRIPPVSSRWSRSF